MSRIVGTGVSVTRTLLGYLAYGQPYHSCLASGVGTAAKAPQALAVPGKLSFRMFSISECVLCQQLSLQRASKDLVLVCCQNHGMSLLRKIALQYSQRIGVYSSTSTFTALLLQAQISTSDRPLERIDLQATHCFKVLARTSLLVTALK